MNSLYTKFENMQADEQAKVLQAAPLKTPPELRAEVLNKVQELVQNLPPTTNASSVTGAGFMSSALTAKIVLFVLLISGLLVGFLFYISRAEKPRAPLPEKKLLLNPVKPVVPGQYKTSSKKAQVPYETIYYVSITPPDRASFQVWTRSVADYKKRGIKFMSPVGLYTEISGDAINSLKILKTKKVKAEKK